MPAIVAQSIDFSGTRTNDSGASLKKSRWHVEPAIDSFTSSQRSAECGKGDPEVYISNDLV
jgi:hypothetical protein